MNILEIKNMYVSFNIGNDALNVVQNLDLCLENKASLSVIGESGSGKSVIASAVIRRLERNAMMTGDVFFKGESIYGMSDSRIREIRGKGICLIPQNAGQSWNPLIRIGPQMGEFLMKAGYSREESASRISEFLEDCGFKDPDSIASSYPHKLSGGMSQRAMIAMCTSVSPELLIADEPTKGLDGQSVTKVMELMHRLAQNGSFMMITHDLYAAKCCRKTVVLYSGVIVEYGCSGKILDSPVHPYSKGLKAAHPKNGMVPISGGGRRNLASGCPFIERCRIRTSECSGEIGMREVDGRMVRCVNV